MKRRLGLFLVAVLLALTSPAFGQQSVGDSELQLQGSLTLGLGGDKPDNGSVFLNYGRFFTDRQEVGVSVFTILDGEGNPSGFGGPFYRYHFSTSKTVPYLGVVASTSFGDFAADDIVFTFEGGVRRHLERNTAFTLAVNSDYRDFSDQLQVLFGFSYLWGK